MKEDNSNNEVHKKSKTVINLSFFKKRGKLTHKKSSIKMYSSKLIIGILQKPKTSRTKTDIKILTEYFSTKYSYFETLKNTDPSKCEKIITVINLEEYKANTTIFQPGEEPFKFYICFQGILNIYKSTFIEKELTLNDFYKYIYDIKYKENNKCKLKRILDKNSYLNLNVDILANMNNHYEQMHKKIKCYIEVLEHLGEYSEGDSFGEFGLVNDNIQNKIIITLTHTYLLSVDKYDYNNVIRELDKEKLEQQLLHFKQTNPLFHYWNFNQLTLLTNTIHSYPILQNEYLYKQNEDSDYIYIIQSGTFEMYSLLSFGWLQKFYDYIKYAESNLLYLLSKKDIVNESIIANIINKTKSNIMKSPCKCNPYKPNIITLSHKKEDNVYDIKIAEEKLNDPCNLFKVKIKTIINNDVIGFEDSLEVKKRFCFVKCVSPHADVRRISVVDFLKIINNQNDNTEINITTLMNVIAEKKAWLTKILKNSVRNYAMFMKKKIDIRYNKLCGKEEIENENIKHIQLAHKLKIWGSEISDVPTIQNNNNYNRSSQCIIKNRNTKSLSNKKVNRKFLRKAFKTANNSFTKEQHKHKEISYMSNTLTRNNNEQINKETPLCNNGIKLLKSPERLSSISNTAITTTNGSIMHSKIVKHNILVPTLNLKQLQQKNSFSTSSGFSTPKMEMKTMHFRPVENSIFTVYNKYSNKKMKMFMSPHTSRQNTYSNENISVKPFTERCHNKSKTSLKTLIDFRIFPKYQINQKLDNIFISKQTIIGDNNYNSTSRTFNHNNM